MVPEGWKDTHLGEFCQQFKRLNTDSAELPPLSITKDNGIVSQATKFKKRIAVKDTSKYKVIKPGEFGYDPMSLYYGAIGRHCLEYDGILSPAYITFDIEKSVCPIYFSLLLDSHHIQQEFIYRTEGGNIAGKRKKTDWAAFSSVPVSIPPLPEQKKIAAILGSVDEAIQATQAVIDQTRKVKQGLLQQLLTRGIGHTRFKQTEIGEIPEGWEVARLAEVVKSNRPITYGIVQTGDPVESGISCVRVVDLVKHKLGTDEMITTSKEISNSYQRTVLEKDDIMFALRGEIGHVRIADESLSGSNLTRGVALISPSSTIYPDYLLWAIRSPSVRAEILIRVNGSALKEIPLGGLRKVRLPIPPMEEQKEISAVLLAAETTINQELDRLTTLGSLKQGLMQDLLTGRVRVGEVA